MHTHAHTHTHVHHIITTNSKTSTASRVQVRDKNMFELELHINLSTDDIQLTWRKEKRECTIINTYSEPVMIRSHTVRDTNTNGPAYDNTWGQYQ